MELAYRIAAVMYCMAGYGWSITKHSVEMTALDCRHPKGIIRSPVATLCDHKKDPLDGQLRSVHVLQYDQARIVPAVTCKLVKTKILAYCGSFSHSKLYEPIDVMVPERVSHDTCVQVYKTNLYTQEDGDVATIAVNRPHTYKYLEHGSLKTSSSNVQCEGEQFSVHNKLRSNMMELVTAQFILHKVSIEVDPADGVKDMDKGYSLPNHCITDGYCYQYARQYVMLAPRSVCPLYKIRSMQMTEIKYFGTDQREHPALVSTEHQLILERREEFNIPKICHGFPKVHNTNYDKIKIVIGKLTPGVISEINSFTLDLSLQTQILHDYANFHAEKLVNSRIDETLHSLCAINYFGVHTLSVDPTRAGYMIQRTGETFTRFACTKTTVLARVGSNENGPCFKDALPVYLGREKLVMTANTRMLLDVHDVQTTTCSSQFPPVFVGNDGKKVVANPAVRIVNFTLSDMDLPVFRDHDRVVHESADHFSLYTKDEIREFNLLLHFGRTKQAVLTELTEKYCHGQACGSLSFGADRQTFDLNRLKNQIENTLDLTHRLEETAQYCGKIGGCLFIAYFTVKVLMKVANATHLYFRRECTLGFSMSTSLYRDRAIDNLLIEHLKAKRKKQRLLDDDKNPKDTESTV